MAAPEYNASFNNPLGDHSHWYQGDQDQKINLNGSGWMPGNRFLMKGLVELLNNRLHCIQALRLHLLPAAAVLLLPAVAVGRAA